MNEKEKDLEDQPKVSEILTNRNFRRQNRNEKRKKRMTRTKSRRKKNKFPELNDTSCSEH